MSLDTNIDMWTNFLPEIRREILDYLDEDDLGELSMVSHSLRDACKDPALSQRRHAIIRFSPDSDDRIYHLHPLGAALLRVPTKTNAYKSIFPAFEERFTYFKIENPSCCPKIVNRDAKPIMNSLRMFHVTHLDLSSSELSKGKRTRQGFPQVPPSVTKLMHSVVPNIKVLDLSHNQVSTATVADASRNYKHLESLILVGGLLASSVTGMDLKACVSLKELYLDNTLISASAKEETDVFEKEEEEAACPFGSCLGNLERVSLKGCQYFNMTARAEDHLIHGKPFTQVGLIKFVRNATNLKWFSSDLTQENIEMLKAERPDVVFDGCDS